MDATFGKDLTRNSVLKDLVGFAMPLFIANFIFYGYGIINTFWVGNLLGKAAVGAIGVSYPLTAILVALAAGMGMGTSILCAQQYGAKKYDTVKQTIDTSVSIANIIIVLATLVCVVFSDQILLLIGTPKEIMEMAVNYFRITVLGFAFTYYYQLIAAILRAIGDSVTILILIILSTVINGILDPLLIAGVGPVPSLGLNGAAVATLISQGVAVVFSYIYFRKKIAGVKFEVLKFHFAKPLVKPLFKIGIPAVLQQCVAFFGTVLVTVVINQFGADAISAFGVVYRIEMLVMVPLFSMSIAIATMVGQSLGAGKFEKIGGIVKWGFILNMVVTLIISTLLFCFSKEIISVFVPDAGVVNKGIEYMQIVSFGYLFLAAMYVVYGVVNGVGNTLVTMAITMISYLIIRFFGAVFLSNTVYGIDGIWFAIVISQFGALVISVGYYFIGGWKKKVEFIKNKMNQKAEVIPVVEALPVDGAVQVAE